jgi:membrane-associated protease RseP (regulator of RpoE activity)
VSSNLPSNQVELQPSLTGLEHERFAFQEPGPSRREWIISAILFFATIITASFAGVYYRVGDIIAAILIFIDNPSTIVYGLPFSIPLLSILLAHELGHYLACRYYGMRCTPPFFIPVPFPVTGTLGAFIKIKSQFINKRSLFDIGIAGPMAGFIFTLPTLWIGIYHSKLIPKGSIGHGAAIFGEPLIFRFLGSIALGYSPDKQEMIAHPIAMAAWVGLLATSLNLLPIWQLDGGHISYAILGRELQKKVSVLAVVSLILLSFWGWPTPSYLLFGLLLLIVGARVRFYHPSTLSDEDKLGPGRLFFGFLALFILILSFTPVPITIT